MKRDVIGEMRDILAGEASKDKYRFLVDLLNHNPASAPEAIPYLRHHLDTWADPEWRRVTTAHLIPEIALCQELALQRATNKAAKIFAASPYLQNLTYLSVAEGWLDPKGIKALVTSPHLSQLTHLDMTGCYCWTRGVAALGKHNTLQNLTYLNLSNNMINDEGVMKLVSCPLLQKLASLDLRWNNISPRGVELLQTSLKNTDLVLS